MQREPYRIFMRPSPFVIPAREPATTLAAATNDRAAHPPREEFLFLILAKLPPDPSP